MTAATTKLNERQLHALCFLASRDGASLDGLAEAIHTPRYGASRTAASLVRRGFVRRYVPSWSNRVFYAVTPAGNDYLASVTR